MPNRLDYRAPHVTVGQSPTIRASRRSAEGLNAMSTFFAGMAKKGAAGLDVEGQKIAEKEALKMVDETGGFEKIEKSGTFWDSYNKAGLTAFAQNLEVDTRKKVSDIEGEHYNSPDTMQKAFDTYIGQVAPSLPLEMRGGFKRDFSVMSQGKVTSANERMIKRSAKAAEEGVLASGVSRAAAARDIGTRLGSVNLQTDEGQKAFDAGMIEYTDLYQLAIANIGGAVADGYLLPLEAANMLQGEIQTLNKNHVMGMFEGSENKEEFFLDVLSGKQLMTIPMLDPETGATIWKTQEVMLGLGDEAEGVRSYMSATVSALRSAQDRARDNVNNTGLSQSEQALAALSRAPTAANYATLSALPTVSASQLATARGIMARGPVETDWLTVGQIREELRTSPENVTIDEIANGPIDSETAGTLFTEREAAIKRSVEVEGMPVFKSAKTQIVQRVGGMVSQNTQIFNLNAKKSKEESTQAAALLAHATKKISMEMMRDGYDIGRSPDGKAEFTKTLPDGTKVQVFDPDAWVTQKIVTLREQLAPNIAEYEKSKAALSDIIIEERKVFNDEAMPDDDKRQMLDSLAQRKKAATARMRTLRSEAKISNLIIAQEGL